MAIEGLYPIFDHWHSVGTLWFYSDPHFSDSELAQYGERPTDEEQIAKINSKVGKRDTIVFLGDIGNIECVKKIRGRKILVCGNHDKGISNYKDVFDEVYAGPVMIGERVILSHEPLNIDWAKNLHGHVHDRRAKNDKYHYNFCAEHINFTPVNIHQWFKEGHMKDIKSAHRDTIDKATKRKKNRGKK